MDSRSVVRRRVAADPSPFSRRFPFVSFLLPLQTVCRAFHTSGTRESGLFKFHPLHSFGCKAHSWRCILIPRVTKRYRTFALLLLSANIILFYIMTACWADFHVLWFPLYRSSVRVVSRSTATLSTSSASRSTATLSTSITASRSTATLSTSSAKRQSSSFIDSFISNLLVSSFRATLTLTIARMQKGQSLFSS
jgi:hypothetical protein